MTMSESEDGLDTGIPRELMCDREGCGHVGVTEADGVRLCRPHEMEAM